MKKIWKLCLLLFLPMLINCSFQSSSDQTRTQKLCAELKRNIIFHSTSVISMNKASLTQEAQTLRLYNKYNCAKFEKNR